MSSLPNPLPSPEPSPVPRPLTPVPPRRRRRWLPAALGLGLMIAGLLAWRALAERNTTPPPTALVLKTLPATMGNMEVRVRVAGSTTARNFANIVAPRLRGFDGGREVVLLSLAASGATLQKGAVVAELDPQNLRDRIDDQVADLRNKENDVKKKVIDQEMDMENLRQSLRVAKSNLDKAQLDMKAHEVRTELDRELLRLAVEEAEAAYNEIQQEVKFKTVSQQADMRITEISLKLEKERVERSNSDLDKFILRTPMDGMLVLLSMPRPGGDQVTYAVGDRLNPGTPFARVIDRDSMQIEGFINQAESSLFRVGQEAVIRLDAYPGVTYKGRVYSIGALAAATGRSQYFVRGIPIQVRIENADKLVIPDLSGSADILLSREDAAVLIPASAVKMENGAAFVQIAKGQRVEKRRVTLGGSNGVQVAIREGLNEGESVVLN